MSGRHALLIGVPQCDDDRFSEIGDVVRNDVDSMRRALEPSGYAVTTFGVDDGGPEPTRTRIRREIRTACSQAPRDGVLLLYFSGHGISVDGREHLVPSDADTTDPRSLVPVTPDDLADCRARLVVFFVDACRDDPARKEAPAPVGGSIPYPAGGSFVLVNGCEPGQRCHYTDTYSIFTQALSQVLDRRHPARALSEVIDEVTREIRRRAKRNEELQQSPGVPHPAMLRDAADVPICDGDELTGAWRRAADTTGLWAYCADEPSHFDGAREAVLSLVENCGRGCGEAFDVLRSRTGIDDPWFDQNYPIRVLERMTSLLGEPAQLRPAEAAVLIAAPFLREVVLAEGIRLAAGIAPTDFTRTYRQGARTDLEITHEMHQQIVRRADGLGRRGRTEERDALAMWLVHQWLTTRQSVWQSALARDCYRRGARLLGGAAMGMTAGETEKLMEALLRAVGARPADSVVMERLNADHLDGRWRALAGVLWLSGTIAADLRRMPAVIADHIGTRMELPLSTVKNAADRLTWTRRSDGALDLRMPCDHPAQHAAFDDMVARASRARDTIARLTIDARIDEALPLRFTARGLRPERRPDDAPAFEVPISRFHLAEDKVRELLMGRQLYDDPALAIRELYQNALDACRYRDVRLEGLRRSGKFPGTWTGCISFRQGFEGDREYIECEDNGVGMDIETLKQVFANAGERFVYRESFRAEQAAWQDLDPPLQLISNSQFGVGVFSYFMLADEITLVTRPVGTNGIVADAASRVDIASSGSMFQITTADELPAGGTRVRLYLTGDDEHMSVLTTMRKLLWISDFLVEVTDHDSTTEIWKPRELRYLDETAESLRYGEDLWWVSGDGGLAADGIRTNEEFFGLLVNLRDTRRPQFTVDRKKLRKWDRVWVREQISHSLPDLINWPGFTLSWLWQVAESNPEIAQQIFEYAVAERVSVPVGSAWGHGAEVVLNDMGCLPYDQELFKPENWLRYFARWFAAWRAGRWARLVGAHPNTQTTPQVITGDGLPIVEPIDGELLGNISHFHRDDAAQVDDILLATVHDRQPMNARMRRLRRYSSVGMNLSKMRDCPSLDITIDKRSHFPLVRAFAAWSRPGEPPHRVVAGWLVKTSAELDLPLGQVLARAAEFMPQDWSEPDIALGELSDRTCTNADAKLVSVDLDGFPPWIDSPLGPLHIVEASSALGRDVAQVLDLCDTFAPLGIEVESRESYPADLTPVEVEALHHVRTIGESLEPLQLVLIASKVRTTVGEVHVGLARLESRGLLKLPTLLEGNDYAPGIDDLEFIETTMMRRVTYQRTRIFTPEKPCVTLTQIIHARHSSQRRITQATKLIPFARSSSPVSWPELVDLAGDLWCSVTDAHTALLATFPATEMPTMIAESKDIYPHAELNMALLSHWLERHGPAAWAITPGGIVGGATTFGQSVGGFLGILEPYRKLGAPLPNLPPDLHAELNQIFPDEYDKDILKSFNEHDSDFYISEFDALTLTQISGRLGMQPSEIHRRLTQFVPIGVDLNYPTDHVPDEIVRWQDLLLLTRFFDGHEPAIAGRVTREHLRQAAEETEESESWIVDRLKLYAPLFELDLGDVVD
ncbi:hypothetical protein BJF79_22280 [Actinomadura sp. CNU-125]|uniref:HD domain-containing protein n=1 Tax=Actinomadura sp. CNU-125 TaxID=1904961 RepID=UPI000961F59C|nr:caspase family protein [Actinomadura sp. CNU-125]OLT12465.1 hypothetical protein BJF79_22280 [Actinomadura sp. CNU-125]